jgi:hypothetical protein
MTTSLGVINLLEWLTELRKTLHSHELITLGFNDVYDVTCIKL